MRTNHFKYSFIIAIFPLLLVACSSDVPESASENGALATQTDLITITNEQFTSSGYRLGGLEKRIFETTVRVNGSVDVPPKYQASISAYFGGYVKQIDLLVGEKVRQGQVLFTLENPDFLEVQKEYLQTAGELTYLQEDLDRQGNLAEANVSSKKKLTKAQADFQMMKAKHAALRKKLLLMHVNVDGLTADNLQSSISILAPIGGYVTEIDATPGRFLSPSDVAMRIINTEHLHLELNVFEQHASSIGEGQNIHFRVQNEKDWRQAKVHLVNRTLDPNSRSLVVHGHVNPGFAGGLAVGSYVEADIVTGEDSLLSLPSAAIVELDNHHYVLRVAEEKDGLTQLERLEVKVIGAEDGFTAIEANDNLAVYDKFLTKGAYDLIVE